MQRGRRNKFFTTVREEEGYVNFFIYLELDLSSDCLSAVKRIVRNIKSEAERQNLPLLQDHFREPDDFRAIMGCFRVNSKDSEGELVKVFNREVEREINFDCFEFRITHVAAHPLHRYLIVFDLGEVKVYTCMGECTCVCVCVRGGMSILRMEGCTFE